jgi:Rrf2 family protein
MVGVNPHAKLFKESLSSMKFSTKAEYGLRAIIRLARSEKVGPLSLSQIAKEEKISLAYLERLIAKLKKAGLVRSTKGVKGGYVLARESKKITVKEIFEALEGTLAPYRCVGIGKVMCASGYCATRQVWQKLQEQIIKTLDAITLKDLI